MTDFLAQKADLCGGSWTSAMGGFFDPGKDAAEILPGLRGGQLFAYLFRRFGYPNQGWDDYKELVTYLITTPMDKVFLLVRPYLGGDYQHGYPEAPDEWDVRVTFGYCISREFEKQLYHVDPWEVEDTEVYQSVSDALRASIRDLLRPVYVRDVPINCYGRIPDKDMDGCPDSVEFAPEAGYGIPRAFFEDIDCYDRFLKAMRKLGNGDIDKGMQYIIALAKDK